jgi:hypothetical protein
VDEMHSIGKECVCGNCPPKSIYGRCAPCRRDEEAELRKIRNAMPPEKPTYKKTYERLKDENIKVQMKDDDTLIDIPEHILYGFANFSFTKNLKKFYMQYPNLCEPGANISTAPQSSEVTYALHRQRFFP